MTRVLMFGLGPMRWEQSTRLFALALRTWHFARSLADAGHSVLLFSIRGHAYEGWPPEKRTLVEREGVTVWSVSEHLCHERPEWLARKIADFAPECAVGVNRDPAAVAVNFSHGLPLWADINGDPLAEAQAKAASLGGDWNIPEWHHKFIPVLLRGDRFSTCSRAQRGALIGQLGMIGRLTANNFGHEFVIPIPNSIDREELEAFGQLQRPPRKAGEPFVLLWSGGYNTWIDPDTLFRAVDGAMVVAPELTFVSTGGGIPGHHLDAYARFRQLVDASPRRSRYEFAGWVQTGELPGYYRAAHAAILVDRACYEGTLGARTRMLDWLAAGVPIVTTRLSEISRDLEARDIALAAECGDAAGLTAAILRLVREPEEARRRAELGRKYAHAELIAERQLAPLVSWCDSPERAPDGEHRAAVRSTPDALFAVRKHLGLFREELRSQGVGSALSKTQDFARRRVRHGVLRAIDRLGLEDSPPPALTSPPVRRAPLEPPKLSVFEWRERLARLAEPPEVAVVVRVTNHDPAEVVEWTLEQVRHQYYPAWRLVVAAPADLKAGLAERLSQLAERFRDTGHAIERASLDGEALAQRSVRTAAYKMILAPGDLLRRDALAELVLAAEEQGAALVYGDEQVVDETNVPRPAQRKPEFSLELLSARNFLGTPVLFRRGCGELGPERFREWPLAAVGYALALSVAETGAAVHRVPQVLCQRYVMSGRPGELRVAEQRALAELEQRCLEESLWRRSISAEIERGSEPGMFRVRYPVPTDRVSVVVLGMETEGQLAACLDTLRQRTNRRMELIAARPRGTKAKLPRGVCGVTPPGRAGDSATALALAGVSAARSEFVVLMHPRVEVISSDWLASLLEQLGRDGVGVVCPKLLLPDGGVFWSGGPPSEPEWCKTVVRDAHGLSPGCLALRRKLAEKPRISDGPWQGYLDELARLALRRGLRVVVTPHASCYFQPTNGAPAATTNSVVDPNAAAGHAHSNVLRARTPGSAR